MTEQTKKYFRVSLTLGLIAGVSALLIGLTNMITADAIEENAKVKETNGLKKVFADVETKEITFDEKESSQFSYVLKAWTATKTDFTGLIYKTSGKNSYGSVTMLVGFDTTANKIELGKIVLLENTETYGSTLEDNYVTPYNNAEDKEAAEADVRCGATYGATLIKNMIDEAKKDAEGRVAE